MVGPEVVARSASSGEVVVSIVDVPDGPEAVVIAPCNEVVGREAERLPVGVVMVGVLASRWSPTSCTWSSESFIALVKVSVVEPRLTEVLVTGCSGSGVCSSTSPAAAFWMSGFTVAAASNWAGAALVPCTKLKIIILEAEKLGSPHFNYRMCGLIEVMTVRFLRFMSS